MPDDDQIDDDQIDESGEADDPSLDGSEEVDPAFYANGGVIFSDDELGVFGDLHGKRVLHLTIGCTEEGPSFVNLGATVTEVGDEGETQALATAAGLTIEFVEDEPAALSAQFCDTRKFDMVYCSWGVMDWIGDFEAWAEGVAAVLPPGGRLVLYDEHPFSYVFGVTEDGQPVAVNSYFGEFGDDAGGEDEDEATDDGEAPPPHEDLITSLLHDDDDNEVADDSGWTLGDLIGALGTKGFGVIDLQEFETSDRYETALDVIAAEMDEEELGLVPSALLLVAVRLP